MNAPSPSRVRLTIDRVRRIWTELDYAQRRLMEIRTGVPLAKAPRRPVDAALADLEALWIESGDERQAGDLPGAIR